ncbi:uracil phosphoribosyltransferase [Fervidicoccus fontis]|uniref:Uracil phosphoribosyltransferase n=1 Tax=Fervidicoccus fontis TaxID=683846 RepID=A0A2J6N8T8_9CREN|nr:uracil phosphoribosyltransferase [Fervidicoccus fontis]MBE9390488.1 uracil phosphoribosyltransferase [Fervidicoccus fontis]PMB75883.1 MAG: uracil phosphoribosyltransferase [Fervidicoccus fontis]PMB77762.1 MAG: uracil phosphoribosyltransferase [Fervidicoccus fontis]HEW64135.1 uracil phosphoribosyltransferase [Fervidicoccus fontis]
MFKVNVIDHPYVQAVLTTLRDKNTSQIEFRKSLVKLGRALGIEITREMEKEEVEVETPLGAKAKGLKFRDMDKVIIITVLRAGTPLTEGLIKIFYNAKQGVVSARRMDELGMGSGKNFEIEVNYIRLPKISGENIVIISDPMLATGSTISKVTNIVLERARPKKIIIVGAIATKVAIEKIREIERNSGVDVSVYIASIDPEINSRGYIVPGLGDAGDRAFGD